MQLIFERRRLTFSKKSKIQYNHSLRCIQSADKSVLYLWCYNLSIFSPKIPNVTCGKYMCRHKRAKIPILSSRFNIGQQLKFYWFVWFINQRAFYNHAFPSCFILRGRTVFCRLCTPLLATGLNIETSYLVQMCTYAPHKCTSNIQWFWLVVF